MRRAARATKPRMLDLLLDQVDEKGVRCDLDGIRATDEAGWLTRIQCATLLQNVRTYSTVQERAMRGMDFFSFPICIICHFTLPGGFRTSHLAPRRSEKSGRLVCRPLLEALRVQSDRKRLQKKRGPIKQADLLQWREAGLACTSGKKVRYAGMPIDWAIRGYHNSSSNSSSNRLTD